MRRGWRWLGLALLAFALAACGQPGAFTLPEDEAPGLAQAATGTVEQVFPLEPVAVDAPAGMVDETPDAWFIQFATAPRTRGGSANAQAAERALFRSTALAERIAFTERFDFRTLFNGVSVSAGPAEIAKLARLPGVTAVFPVETIAIPEPVVGPAPELYTALGMTGADYVQAELGFTGAGVKVAVMDTGIDYDHPDLGGCFGPGCRVQVGWDFVGDAFNADSTDPGYNPVPVPDPFPDDCNGHGTHVAGIVGAAGTVVGVAPDATFGAYRVFGCTGSTTADIMIAAMERALADGMDVLNMSIGSAYQWPQYPTAVAASNLVRAGMVVVASIGNNGPNGLYAAGAPGLGEDVIGVASFDNTHVFLPYATVNGQNIGYLTMAFSPAPPTTGTFEVVDVGLACSPLAVDLTGKVALATRGACAFGVKAANASNAGAAAVLISNSLPGVFNGTLGAPIPGVAPTVGISLADGNYIRAQAIPVSMTWTDQMASFPSPTGGLISSFSSYGLSPDLALKPDIGAPGGNIYSTYPLEAGGYATLGGTSMSSPHVAGAVALLLQAEPRLRASEVRGVLQNAAEPKDWWGAPGAGYLDNLHRQGAGMLDIAGAITSPTRVTPAKVAMGESEAGVRTHTLWIENRGSTTLTYDLSYVNALSTGGVITPSFFTSDASVSFDVRSVTVRAGGKARVRATITPASGPAYGQYGGYLVATPRGEGLAAWTARVPFAGFVGDYQGIEILTPTVNGFPWLAILYEGSYYGPVTGPDDWAYTMVGDDVPQFLLHFDHHPQYMEMKITSMANGQLVHPVFHKTNVNEYLPRNSTATGFFAFAWDGTYFHSASSNGRGNQPQLFRTVPDGDYVIELRVLRALGNAKNPAHWETWTSPVIRIDRP